MAAAFAVGDEVVFTPKVGAKPQPAVVRFVGPLGGKEDLVGLEFLRDGCGGCHDGYSTTLAQRGFSCPQGRGRYVPASHPRLARAEPPQTPGAARDKQTLMVIGSNLEERMETTVLKQRSKVQAMNGVLRAQGQLPEDWVKRWVPSQGRYLYFDRAKVGEHGRSQPPPGAVVDPEPEGGPEMRTLSTVGTDYAGPILADIRDGTVSEPEAQELFNHVATRPDVPLHADFLLPLIWRAVDLFGQLPTVMRCPVPPGGRVIVLGDTHGHLKDVVHAFRTFGLPSPMNVYLVNGDVCDRGDTPDRGDQQGINIWSVLLAYKVLYPGSLYFNRGNHEDWYTNDVEGPYGQDAFHAEIHDKYPTQRDAVALKNAFRELFFSLPLVHVVGERVMVLHGGLWRSGYEAGHQRRCAKPVRLKDFEALNRRRDIPADAEKRCDMIMLDTCWSDPHEGEGVLPNPRGGATVTFGGDVTASALDREGLAMLVRSHDWPRNNEPHGHEWFHFKHNAKAPRLEGQDALCLSVFTASDYCGDSGNNGALVIFTGEAGIARSAVVHEWSAEVAMSTWNPSWQSLAPSWRRAGTEQDLLWRLRTLVVEFKHELFSELSAEDANRDFNVTATVWAEVCGRVLGDFPWLCMLGRDPRRSITSPSQDDPNSVCYTEFLARHQIRFRNKLGRHSGFRRAIAGALYESLMMDDEPLRDTLAAIDPTGDGRVSCDDLQVCLSRVLDTVTNEEQAWTLLRTTVAGGESGVVDVHAFLNSIQVRFSSTHAKPAAADADWVPAALTDVGRDILRTQRSRETVSLGDSMRSTMGPLGRAVSIRSTSPAVDHTISTTSRPRSARSTVAPSETIMPPSMMRERSGSTKANVLLSNFFTAHDKNASGYLEREEFKDSLRTLPACAGYTEADLDKIVDYCDLLGNGRINYLEFLHSFNIEANSALAEGLHEDLLEGIYRVLYFQYRSLVSSALRRYVLPMVKRCSPHEFEMALCAVNTTQGLLAEAQIALLIDTLSVDEDGLFDFEDFFASFEIVDTALGTDEDTDLEDD